MKYEIRRFAPDADNEGVLNVARTLAIPARVQLGIDRSPDFAAFDTALGDPFEILVAEAEGEIVGFIELCLGRFRLHEDDTIGVHVPLGGVRPDWRGRGVLGAMRNDGFDLARRMGAEWAYILVNANNRLVQDILRRAYPGLIALNRLLVHGIVVPRTPSRGSRNSRYDIRAVDDADWPELPDFVLERMQACDLYPKVETSRWRALTDYPSEHYQVARDQAGQIVATLGSWDPTSMKRALVLGYGGLERIFLRPINSLLSTIGIRPFPLPGGELRLLYTLFPLARPGHEAALGQMIAGLRRERRDYNAVLTAFPEGDSRNRLVRNYFGFTNINIPLLIPLTPGLNDQLRSHPPRTFYIEYAFI